MSYNIPQQQEIKTTLKQKHIILKTVPLDTINSYFHGAITVNAEEMIDLQDIVHRKSIHSGLDCFADGLIGGGSRNFQIKKAGEM